MRLLKNSLWLALLLVLTGCTPWATYPPIEGAAGMSNPGLAPIPMLMAESIRFAHQQDGGEEPIVFNLPPDTAASVYGKVIAKLDGGVPMTEPDLNAYHVTAVRIRTVEAEVDVIHPGADGVPQLMTISFKQNVVKGWYIKRHRDWRLRVEVPAPNYVAPEQDEPEAEQDESAAPEANEPQSLEEDADG